VTCQFDGPIAEENETMETPHIRRLYFEVYSSSPLAQLYKWKDETIFQGIWDKSEMVWEHVGEHIGNPLGTWREHSVNTLGSWEIWKNSPPWVHAWAFPLAAWNFSSQKTSSPFLAWANTPCKEHPTYSVLGHVWFSKYQLPGFSNISDLENCRFWIYQNLTTMDRFHKRTGGYLTNSNSHTAKVKRIRNRLLKLVASTLIIIIWVYELNRKKFELIITITR